MLPHIITYLRAHGYKFVAIDEMLASQQNTALQSPRALSGDCEFRECLNDSVGTGLCTGPDAALLIRHRQFIRRS